MCETLNCYSLIMCEEKNGLRVILRLLPLIKYISTFLSSKEQKLFEKGI